MSHHLVRHPESDTTQSNRLQNTLPCVLCHLNSQIPVSLHSYHGLSKRDSYQLPVIGNHYQIEERPNTRVLTMYSVDFEVFYFELSLWWELQVILVFQDLIIPNIPTL